MVILDFPAQSDPHPQPLFARSGWKIPQPNPPELKQYQREEDLVRYSTVAVVDSMLRKGQKALTIRSVSAHLYNCVGMVFANRRAWIDIEFLRQILSHDGYHQVEEKELHVGDVVVYTLDHSPVHVGLITCVNPKLGSITNIRVLSKWGKDGEVEHGLSDVPSRLGQPSEYWSERVPHDIRQLHRGC